jgi:hypothetical protein
MLTYKDQLVPEIITLLQSCPLVKPVGFPEKNLQKNFDLHLSKTTSFRVNQTAQHKADAAVNNNKLCLFLHIFDHLLKRSPILRGGEILNIKCSARHKNLACEQSKKRC